MKFVENKKKELTLFDEKKKKRLSSHKDCLFPFLTCYYINTKFNQPHLSLVEKSSNPARCTESPNFSWRGGGEGGCPHNPPNSATYIFHWLIHKFLNTYNPKRTLGSFLLFLYLLIAVLTAEGGRMGCFPSALMTTSISFGSLT